MRLADRLLHALNLRRIGEIARIIYPNLRPVRSHNAIDNAGGSRDQIEIKLSLEPLLRDLHMQKSKKTASEAISKCLRGLGFI